MHHAFTRDYPEILEELAEDYVLTDQLTGKIEEAMHKIFDDFKGMRIDGE